MAAGVKVITDADGAACLVGTVDGMEVTFATVNASQLHELKAAQDAADGEPEPDTESGESGF